MCHTVHYTDRDKTEFCADGRAGIKCKHTEEWVNSSRKHVLSKLDISKVETPASLADRLPTPYMHLPPTPHLSKSPSPHRDGPGVYVNGTKVVELSKPRKHRDTRDDYDRDRDYHYERRSSRYLDSDPRDRDDDRRDRRTRREDREPPSKVKRSSTLPQYVVIDQEKPRRRSRDDIDGPEDLTKEYNRRRRPSRERERDPSPGRGLYYRKHTADGYAVVDDDKERRQLRRERRRSVDYDSEPPVFSTSTAALRYTPRRTSTIVHHSDGTTVKKSPKTKQLRWDDEVRVKREPLDVREAQNQKIASRPKQRSDPDRDPRLKGILKHTDPNIKKSRGDDDYRAEEFRRDEELRRAVEDMGISNRGRSRKPQEWDEQVERLRTRLGEDDRGDRRKRSKVWLEDRYEYR